MTITDCCISLKMIKKFLVVLGVVDMGQLLLKIISLTTDQNLSLTTCVLKIESASKINIFGLKMMVKSVIEKQCSKLCVLH